MYGKQNTYGLLTWLKRESKSDATLSGARKTVYCNIARPSRSIIWHSRRFVQSWRIVFSNITTISLICLSLRREDTNYPLCDKLDIRSIAETIRGDRRSPSLGSTSRCEQFVMHFAQLWTVNSRKREVDYVCRVIIFRLSNIRVSISVTSCYAHIRTRIRTYAIRFSA